MKRLRLLIVSPRHWPLVGDQERFQAQLAEELSKRDVQVTVLTARWQPHWPDRVVHRQVTVVRLAPAPRGGWTTFRYLRELSAWISQYRREFDVIYVMNLRQEAYTVLSVVQSAGPPVLLRAQRAGWSGDCAWQERARLGNRMRKRCREATAIVASCEAAEQELLAAGYLRVRSIPCGAAVGTERSASLRHHARAALAEINCDLTVAEYAPVAVCVEQFEERRGLAELIRAWVPLAARWPASQLWLIGDGPLREAFHQQIVDLGLPLQVLMPGSFDDLEELFLAADAYVSACPDFSFTQSLVEAMASGLPVVARDTPDIRELIEPEVHGLLVPRGEPRALSDALARLFESAALAQQLGQAARQIVQARHLLSRAVDQHLELFAHLSDFVFPKPR